LQARPEFLLVADDLLVGARAIQDHVGIVRKVREGELGIAVVRGASASSQHAHDLGFGGGISAWHAPPI
jgi:hypothetical protein